MFRLAEMQAYTQFLHAQRTAQRAATYQCRIIRTLQYIRNFVSTYNAIRTREYVNSCGKLGATRRVISRRYVALRWYYLMARASVTRVENARIQNGVGHCAPLIDENVPTAAYLRPNQRHISTIARNTRNRKATRVCRSGTCLRDYNDTAFGILHLIFCCKTARNLFSRFCDLPQPENHGVSLRRKVTSLRRPPRFVQRDICDSASFKILQHSNGLHVMYDVSSATFYTPNFMYEHY